MVIKLKGIPVSISMSGTDHNTASTHVVMHSAVAKILAHTWDITVFVTLMELECYHWGSVGSSRACGPCYKSLVLLRSCL